MRYTGGYPRGFRAVGHQFSFVVGLGFGFVSGIHFQVLWLGAVSVPFHSNFTAISQQF